MCAEPQPDRVRLASSEAQKDGSITLGGSIRAWVGDIAGKEPLGGAPVRGFTRLAGWQFHGRRFPPRFWREAVPPIVP
jgi:hypothetical protein